jgi:hypothetical protein
MLNWNEFFQIILLLALACFASYYAGIDKGVKEERERILDRYDIKMK